jgi:transposase-like protein
LTGEAIDPSSRLVATEVGVHRVRFPSDVIVLAVRWYLRYNLSYRDVENS